MIAKGSRYVSSYLASRASSIARLVGESMAGIHPSQNRTLDRLSIGPIQVSPNSTDQDIAHSVTERIASTLRREI